LGVSSFRSFLGRVRGGAERSWTERARRLALALVIVDSVALFALYANDTYAIRDWLFWRYAKAWGWALYYAGGALVGGLALVQRLVPRAPLRERVLFGFTAGVYLFYCAMFLGGLAGLYGNLFAAALPGVLCLAGAASLRGSLVRFWRNLRRFRPSPPAWWTFPAFALGAVCVAAIYLTILSPRNAAFDSVWYHLGIGQQLAEVRAIRPTPEGWFVDALPQLAAISYAWCFLLPGASLFDSVEVAAHMELVLFLATLFAIPVLVRWLVPRARAGAAWAALFLFPAVFVYDANLSIANDHVAAFFAIPILLALRRSLGALAPRWLALTSLFLGCALLTKYQAASLVAGPVVAVLARAAWLGVRHRAVRRAAAALGVALAVGLVATTPHWLKNWAFYGDPLFPALHAHLDVHPWNPDASAMMERNWSTLVKRPTGTLGAQLLETLERGIRFSFDTYARRAFHRDLPIFGALFTLSLLWLPFLRASRRLWGTALATQLGVFVWYYVSHVERYLQALVPWMAAVVAAAVALAWRSGMLARLSVAAAVGFQLVWGADAYFFPTHSMSRGSPIGAAIELVITGFKKSFDARDRLYGSLQDIGDALPRGAGVLLHEHNPRLGLRARVITDSVGFQGAISYAQLGSPREIYDALRRLGVTHVVTRDRVSRGSDSFEGDLRFWEFVHNVVVEPKTFGSMALGRLPDTPPGHTPPELVAYLGCGRTYAPGVHELDAMNVRGAAERRLHAAIRPLPSDPDALHQMLETVGYAVYDPRCKHVPPASVLSAFAHVATRKGEQLWVRTPP
jgi:hypothetical protein